MLPPKVLLESGEYAERNGNPDRVRSSSVSGCGEETQHASTLLLFAAQNILSVNGTVKPEKFTHVGGKAGAGVETSHTTKHLLFAGVLPFHEICCGGMLYRDGGAKQLVRGLAQRRPGGVVL
jgi:hypothetical protein